MIVFWLVTILMMVVAVLLLAPALLGRLRVTQQDQNQQNIRIARERLAELEAEHKAGTIDTPTFDRTRQELEQTLLADVSDETQTPSLQADSDRRSLFALFLIVPALTLTLYYTLGTPQIIPLLAQQADSQAAPQTAQAPMESVDVLAEKLAQRLQEQPDNAEGWFMLGRTYMSMGRYNEAVNALQKVYELEGDHPVILLTYADALTMANNGRLAGKPFELVMKALQLEPQNPTGLWLAGMAYAQQGDDNKALDHWRQLLPLLAENPDAQAQVRDMMTAAQQRLGQAPEVAQVQPQPQPESPPVAAAAKITVEVSIDPALRDKVDQNATVFVFARAEQGPPMPLAVARKQVRDLPFTVTLDDSMAMMPSMKISSFPSVQVSARVSRSGQANAASGDLQAAGVSVQVSDAASAALRIDQQVP